MRKISIIPLPEDRFQVDQTYRGPHHTFDQQKIANIVGLVAFLLPAILILAALIESDLRHTISHYYYYAPFSGEFFVGSLCFIGAMLIVFTGGNRRETRLTTYAGIAALLVPLMPTSDAGFDSGSKLARPFATVSLADADQAPTLSAPGSPSDYFDLFSSISGTVHYVCAAALFAVLAFLCLVVFTRTDKPVNLDAAGKLKPAKAMRNSIYRITGSVIVTVMLVLGVKYVLYWFGADLPWWNHYRLTFVAETVMIWAFALSWFTKGRFFGKALKD